MSLFCFLKKHTFFPCFPTPSKESYITQKKSFLDILDILDKLDKLDKQNNPKALHPPVWLKTGNSNFCLPKKPKKSVRCFFAKKNG